MVFKFSGKLPGGFGFLSQTAQRLLSLSGRVAGPWSPRKMRVPHASGFEACGF